MNYKNILFGPMGPNGQYEGETLEFRSSFDSLEEARGIYHENNVVHSEAHAELKYSGYTADIIPSDRTIRQSYPQSVTMRNISRYPTPSLTTTNAYYGHASSSGHVGTQYNGYNYNFRAVEFVATGFVIYEIDSPASMPSYITAQRYVCTVSNPNNGDFKISVSRTRYSTRWTPWLWSSLPGLKQVKDAVAGSTVSSVAALTEYGARFQYAKAYSASPAVIDGLLAKHIMSTFKLEPFPIKGKHAGELEQEAVSKMNANEVNMFAFLRDLRQPMELVPKLRNLSQLKNLADNYLTVNYGILPTISDLQEIASAFRKMKPYVDRNGFNTYSAGHTEQLEDNGVTYKLEQHCKVAISDSDSRLVDLVNRVESAGFMPTFENLWDLIPYSFVVDWFIDVGEFLGDIDTHLRLLRLDVRYATTSRKKIAWAHLEPSDILPYSGLVEVVQYRRRVSDQCPVPPLSLDSTFQDFNHWLEASALIIQRAK